MAETEGMVHRERKVNVITTILEGTAFKRSYFNKLQTFCKETLSLNVAEHYSYIIIDTQKPRSFLHPLTSSSTGHA